MDEAKVLDAVGQWLAIFALIAGGSVVYILMEPARRAEYLQDGKVDLRALWRVFRQAFGTGAIAFIVFFAMIIGGLVGVALLR